MRPMAFVLAFACILIYVNFSDVFLPLLHFPLLPLNDTDIRMFSSTSPNAKSSVIDWLAR